jgi:hypothetical protein
MCTVLFYCALRFRGMIHRVVLQCYAVWSRALGVCGLIRDIRRHLLNSFKVSIGRVLDLEPKIAFGSSKLVLVVVRMIYVKSWPNSSPRAKTARGLRRLPLVNQLPLVNIVGLGGRDSLAHTSTWVVLCVRATPVKKSVSKPALQMAFARGLALLTGTLERGCSIDLVAMRKRSFSVGICRSSWYMLFILLISFIFRSLLA